MKKSEAHAWKSGAAREIRDAAYVLYGPPTRNSRHAPRNDGEPDAKPDAARTFIEAAGELAAAAGANSHAPRANIDERPDKSQVVGAKAGAAMGMARVRA